MDITSATFVTSRGMNLAQCPTDGRSEFAFIGRSNVGKSSLINMLTQTKGLAKTSSTPGKTQLINHFLINNSFYIVDLPGYGYAKVPKAMRGSFKQMIESYIMYRQELVNLFVLVDIRHTPMKIDIDFINGLGLNRVPFSIVFTKADKLSNKALHENVEVYQNELLKSWGRTPTYLYHL